MANVLSGLWSRSFRPSARPRRRARYPATDHAPALERLERRLLLTAGDVRWNVPADFSGSTDDWFNDVAVQADGKIVAVGWGYRAPDDDFLVARYTADGRRDPSFNGDGVAYYDVGGGSFDRARGVVIQSDGKIVVAGETGNADSGSLLLVRFNPDGTRDTSYGTGGRTIESLSGSFLGASDDAIALTPDGGVVVGVDKVSAAGVLTGAVYKFDAAGVKDATFDGTGSRDVTTINFDTVADVAVDAAGRIVAVTDNGAVVRLISTGGFDGTFSGDGRTSVSFDAGTSPHLDAVAIAADGKIVVAGTSSGTAADAGVARLNDDGTYDDTFDGNGRYSFDPGPTADVVNDLAVLPGGAVVVVGGGSDLTGSGWVALLTPGGVLDSAFAGDGSAAWTIKAGSYYQTATGVAVTREGHYVVAGRASDPAPPTFEDDFGGVALFEGRYPRRDDLAGWTNAGQWWVASSNGSAFQNRFFGSWDPGLGWKIVAAGDVNGDGRADVVGRDGAGRWWVGVNNGTAFATALWGQWTESAGWRDERFADFNSDGRIDVAGRTAGGQWWVMTSAGTRFNAATAFAVWSPSAGWRDVLAADFTGDGKTDLAGRTSGGQWWVSRYNVGANTFRTDAWAAWTESVGWRDVRAGDFDGDGRADLAGRTSGGQWWVSRSGGTSFTSTTAWATWTESAGWNDVVVGDFNADGRADIAGRTAGGQWWVAVTNSAGTAFTNRLFDSWSPSAGWRDIRVGDFDGNGITDIAGRTSGGQWWISRVGFETTLWATWTESAGWRAFRDEFTPTLT